MKRLLWCMMLSSTVVSISGDQPASDESAAATECSPARKVSWCIIPSPIKTGLMTQKSQSVLPLFGPYLGASISGLNCVLFSTTGAGAESPWSDKNLIQCLLGQIESDPKSDLNLNWIWTESWPIIKISWIRSDFYLTGETLCWSDSFRKCHLGQRRSVDEQGSFVAVDTNKWRCCCWIAEDR